MVRVLALCALIVTIGARGVSAEIQGPLPTTEDLSVRLLMPSGPLEADRPPVIVVPAAGVGLEEYRRLADRLAAEGYNVFLYRYDSLEDLRGASSRLADAAMFLGSRTRDGAIRMVAFGLGGVIARGAAAVFPAHPEVATIASGHPEALTADIVTVDAPVGSLATLTGSLDPQEYFAGLPPSFYAAFNDPSSWYLGGESGPNIQFAVGTRATGASAASEADNLPGGTEPSLRFTIAGTPRDLLRNDENVDRVVEALEKLSAGSR